MKVEQDQVRSGTIEVEKFDQDGSKQSASSVGDDSDEFYTLEESTKLQSSINNRIVSAQGVLNKAQCDNEVKALLPKDYQLFELQDQLIQESIEQICIRFNVVFDVLRKNGLHLEPVFRQEQAKW